jgi:hypothetical protein
MRYCITCMILVLSVQAVHPRVQLNIDGAGIELDALFKTFNPDNAA